MDLFSRTMLACSAEAGLTSTALSRHVPLLGRNIGPGDQVSLLSRCVGSDGLGSGDHVLMLTGERMVVTRQSRLLGRVRLCLDAPVTAIENLRWSADPAGPGVELNFTVLEGPGATELRRWHFWLPATHAKRVWRIDALLARAFRRPIADAQPAVETIRPSRSVVFADVDRTGDSVAEDTVAEDMVEEDMVEEDSGALVRTPLVKTTLVNAVMPAGTHPTSPLPAPNVGLTAPRAANDRSMPFAGTFLPPDDRPAEALPCPDLGINANRQRPVPPQSTGFRPTGFDTTLVVA